MNQRQFAKHLRANPTDAEHVLWRHLRARRLDGSKFRRQQPIGRYMVDFVHFGARLVVEADGGQHSESAHDSERDHRLRGQGFRVLRLWSHDVLLRADEVLEAIWNALREAPPVSRGVGGAVRDQPPLPRPLSPCGGGLGREGAQRGYLRQQQPKITHAASA